MPKVCERVLPVWRSRAGLVLVCDAIHPVKSSDAAAKNGKWMALNLKPQSAADAAVALTL